MNDINAFILPNTDNIFETNISNRPILWDDYSITWMIDEIFNKGKYPDLTVNELTCLNNLDYYLSEFKLNDIIEFINKDYDSMDNFLILDGDLLNLYLKLRLILLN